MTPALSNSRTIKRKLAIIHYLITKIFTALTGGAGNKIKVLGPNLQNFVKCTYENVTRELRIVL